MKKFFLLTLLAGLCFSAKSEDLVLWQDYSLTYLWGEHFKVDPEEQQTITLEHVSGLSFGDTFTFIDFTRYSHSDESEGLYGETVVRFSYNKIANQNFTVGPVTDVLFATSLEFGKGPVESFLFGPSVDLNIPGFDFVQVSLFRREGLNDDDKNISEGWQLTPAWSMTIPVGRSEIVFDGFFDWVFATDDKRYEENFHFNPQLKYNLGKVLFSPDTRFYVCIEYDYWSNKYGIDDSDDFKTDQNVVSLLAKYHF